MNQSVQIRIDNPTAALRRCVEAGIDAAGGSSRIFFRADDIGVPSANWQRLMALFAGKRVPLSAAVVPAWITARRWRHIRKMGDSSPELWCWHQHGWRHVNHEPEGRKQEFGPARSADSIARDLKRGRDRLADILQEAFIPVFTAPWNRCSAGALAALVKLNFAAVSRKKNAQPAAPRGLREFPVHVDLHTRTQTSASNAGKAVLKELRKGIAGGCCGVMIHHRQMNDQAFEILETLLQILVQNARIELVNFCHLLASRQREGPAGGRG